MSIIKRCTINVNVTQNNLLVFCLLAKSSAMTCKLILSTSSMNICKHSIIETVISYSASKAKPFFDSSHDTETPFCKSRNESYAAVNLKQFMYFQKAFLACQLFA